MYRLAGRDRLARSAGFLPQMTAAEFAAALKANGFRVVRAKIEDTIARSRR
jgi:hypothetical protein